MSGEKFDFVAEVKENPRPELKMWGFADEKVLKIYQNLPPHDFDLDIWTKDLLKSDYYVYQNKTVYLGNWKNGQKHGFGIFIDEQGQIYEGSFVMN